MEFISLLQPNSATCVDSETFTLELIRQLLSKCVDAPIN